MQRLLKQTPHGSTNRIWFPMCETKFHGLTLIDFNEVTTAAGRDIGRRMIYAIRQEDEAAIRSLVSKLADPTQLETASSQLEYYFSVAGYAFPDASLSSTRTSPEDLEHLAISLALTIRHFSNPTSSTDSPNESIVSSTGQCIDRASIMVSICRNSGILARVVGHPNFFGDHEDDGHWWIEAQVRDQWQSHDPSFNADFGPMSTVLEFDPVALSFMIENYHSRNRPINYINNPVFAEKVKSRVITAEADY